MTRYTINPDDFTESQWEELVNASPTLIPIRYEAKHNAKPVKRPKHHIELAIEICLDKADDKRAENDEEWAEDLEGAAEVLRKLVGPVKLSKAKAQSRLYDLLNSDIYTDAPEYASRVEAIHQLLPIAFGGSR